MTKDKRAIRRPEIVNKLRDSDDDDEDDDDEADDEATDANASDQEDSGE